MASFARPGFRRSHSEQAPNSHRNTLQSGSSTQVQLRGTSTKVRRSSRGLPEAYSPADLLDTTGLGANPTYDYAVMAVKALRKHTGMAFHLDNVSVPPFVAEMHDYVAHHRHPLSRRKLMKRMEWLVRRKMLCDKHMEDEDEQTCDDSDRESGPTTRERRSGVGGASVRVVSTRFKDREEWIDESCFETE
ncbi:MAG: hypothetical protein M1833_000405 [Piccolia ochrophora]|nr:MAG: hypothetical protein M1833_000405 [Piccolia ochrophora]